MRHRQWGCRWQGRVSIIRGGCTSDVNQHSYKLHTGIIMDTQCIMLPSLHWEDWNLPLVRRAPFSCGQASPGRLGQGSHGRQRSHRLHTSPSGEGYDTTRALSTPLPPFDDFPTPNHPGCCIYVFNIYMQFDDCYSILQIIYWKERMQERKKLFIKEKFITNLLYMYLC